MVRQRIIRCHALPMTSLARCIDKAAIRSTHHAVAAFIKVKPFAGVPMPLHSRHLMHAGGS
jgi:hypothetical protein